MGGCGLLGDDSLIEFRWRPAVLLLLLESLSPVHAASAPQPYTILPKTCDGLPRVDVGTAPGYCLGLVLAPEAGKFSKRLIRSPRMLLQLPDERWLLTDLGNWTDGLGKLWELRRDGAGRFLSRAVASGLSLPHTVAYGPDGEIYLSEMHRISRVNPDTGALTSVITGLPSNKLHIGRHPLSHFIFDANGDLLVNVGADSDQCATRATKAARACEEADGPDPRAAIRRYGYLGNGSWDPKFQIHARGLRNSLVLVRHPSGTLLQGENSFDFAPSEPRPHEELNVLVKGSHFGWPYCYDNDQQAPAWRGRAPKACNAGAYQAPALLLPPHSAPLGGLYYDGALFPSLKGRLLLGLHGYFPTGSRILAYEVDAHGIPVAGEPLDLTPGWALRTGQRPAGAPVALTSARDGSLWIADDRNAAVLRLSIDRP
jgi:glucose/arabinose dehydrogenase